MKKWILSLVAMVVLMFSVMGYSAAILTITPSSTIAIVLASGDSNNTTTYTVINNSDKTVNNLIVDVGFGLDTSIITATASGSDCTSLGPGPSLGCSFTANLTAANKVGTEELKPRVCVEGGVDCSIPVAADRISVTVNKTITSIAITPTTPTTMRRKATQQFTATATYSDNSTADITTSVTWNSSNTSVATIGASTGAMTGVAIGTSNITASLSGVTSNTVALTLKDFAYVANAGDNKVSYCPMNSNGTFESCTAVTGSGTFSTPQGVSINPAHSRLYVANNGGTGETISNCELSADGSLGTCTSLSAVPSGLLSAVKDITFSPNGNHAYVANGSTTTTAVCDVISGGTFNGCANSVHPTSTTIQSVALNPLGTFAYFADSSAPTIHSCPAASSVLSACAPNTSAAFSSPHGIAIHPSYSTSNFAYIANGGSTTNPVVKCTINTSTGAFSSCAAQAISGVTSRGAQFLTFHPSDNTKLYITDTGVGGNQVILATVNATSGDITAWQSLTDSTFNTVEGIAID